MASGGPARIPNSDPARQRIFVIEIVKILDNPAEAAIVPIEYVREADEYVKKLTGEHAIDEESKWKITAALLPKVPTLPPGYKSNAAEQRAFLNSVRSKFAIPYNLAIVSNRNLKEAAYYAETFSNHNALGRLTKEQSRRLRPPFRTPEPSRPNMPPEAAGDQNEILGPLLNRIYIGSAARQQEAYHTFVSLYLTDWVDRAGYTNTSTGQRMMRRPFFDQPEFLIFLEKSIDKFLGLCHEQPGRRTLNKIAGNTPRQQLFKDLREKIRARLVLLQAEAFNQITRGRREERAGGRTKTYRRRHSKKRRTTARR